MSRSKIMPKKLQRYCSQFCVCNFVYGSRRTLAKCQEFKAVTGVGVGVVTVKVPAFTCKLM